eukprot:scaffold9678_cov90-Isochrysis_galbana.AAC.1
MRVRSGRAINVEGATGDQTFHRPPLGAHHRPSGPSATLHRHEQGAPPRISAHHWRRADGPSAALQP